MNIRTYLVGSLVVLASILVWLCAFPPVLSFTLDKSKITHQSGYLYAADLSNLKPSRLYRVDNDAIPEVVSKLQLMLDGAPVGTPHSQHVAIAGEGKGRYSHWNSSLYFSMPDNSDPIASKSTIGFTDRMTPRKSLVYGTAFFSIIAFFAVLSTSAPIILSHAEKFSFVRDVMLESRARKPSAQIWIAGIVAAALLLRLFVIPPVFWAIDSLVLFEHPLTYVPHWPWGSPVMVSVAKSFLGSTSSAVLLVISCQLLIYGISIYFLSKEFETRAAKAFVLFGILFQFYVLVIEGAISTEPFASSALVLGFAATIVFMKKLLVDGKINALCAARCMALFSAAVFLAASTRLPYLPLVCIFPATIGLYWLTTFATRRSQKHIKMLIFASGFILLAFFVQSTLTSSFVCRLGGNPVCLSPYGKAGSEVIAFDLRKEGIRERGATVSRLQAQTSDPLVRDVFSAAADDTVQASWLPIQEEVRKIVDRSSDAALKDRLDVPGELEKATGTATRIFQVHERRLFYKGTMETASQYLALDAIRRFISGDFRVLRETAFTPARDWFSTSESAVDLANTTYKDVAGIFSDRSIAASRYKALKDSTLVAVFDATTNSIVAELLFSILLVAAIITWLRDSRALPLLTLALAAIICLVGYSVLMAASVGPILDRYRMPSCFFLWLTVICAMGVMLDLRRLTQRKVS